MSEQITNSIRRLLPGILAKKVPRKIKLVEISERKSHGFNRLYKKKDRPADVLSFRYGRDYGEILICPEVIRREAREQGNTYKYQMTWMIVHGMLHLAGIHHEKSSNAARRAEILERQIFLVILRRFNLLK